MTENRPLIAIGLLLLFLVIGPALAEESSEEPGEVRVMLVFSQSTGPTMLNRIQADIGTSEPEVETWRRGATANKKLKPGNYTIVALKTEVCAFEDCAPCPDRSQTITVNPTVTYPINFRWKAKWDRVEKKWTCQ